MAAPPEVTTKNLTGRYIMNKTLSDDSDAILSLQGVGWVTRKAISVATVTLHVQQTPEANGDVIKIVQVLTGGIKGSTEIRTLDFQKRSHVDHVFGEVEGVSRTFTPISGLDDKILTRDDKGAADATDLKVLKAEVLADGKTPSNWLPDTDQFIQSYVENASAGWTAEQIWGFEEVEGKRRYTRRVVVRKKNGKVIRARLVYDYAGEPGWEHFN